jgi:serine/threonine protein kinase
MLIDRYEIEETLGKGGTSVVYRARDMLLRRTVALKVLENLPQEQEQEWIKILREARLASSLNHPNICTVYDAGGDEGYHYIAMEYVQGSRLYDSIPKGGLDGATVIRYGVQLAAALAHAHERGVLHGDIKSANVLLTSDGQLKLTDFGLGRRFRQVGVDKTPSSSQALLEAGPVGGTLGYTAPEVLRGGANSVKSDIWSLGAVLCEMATGHLPPIDEGGVGGQMADLAAGPQLSFTFIPSDLDRIIRRCLEENPERRQASASDVAYDLETAAKYPGAENHQQHWRRVRRVLLPAIVGVSVLSALLLVAPTRKRLLHRAPVPTVLSAPAHPARGTNPEAKVWVNEKSRVYHCPTSVWYGKTATGEYMRQDQAQAKGYRPAFGQPCE